MNLDIERLRQDTPGVANVIHFNNAGAALPTRETLARVIGHLELEAAIGGYEAAERADAQVEDAYAAVAALLGAQTDEIALVESATRAWAAAFYALPLARGDRILTGTAEYASNVLAYLQMARRTGAEIVVVPDDQDGQLDVRALESLMDSRVRLIAITHVPTNGGLVNPAARVGAVARAAGVPFLLDACQSAGQLDLDVATLQCDLLSATGRKYLRGPRATGFLYVRRAWIEQLEPPLIDLHSATWTSRADYRLRGDARRFETWESFVAGRIGLGAAVRYALALGLPQIEARVAALAQRLREQLGSLPGVRVHDKGAVRCGIVTFDREGEPAADLQARLAAMGINTSVAVREGTRYDMDERNLDSLVRASVHYYNTDDEIDRFCRAVDQGQ